MKLKELMAEDLGGDPWSSGKKKSNNLDIQTRINKAVQAERDAIADVFFNAASMKSRAILDTTAFRTIGARIQQGTLAKMKTLPSVK